MALSGNKIWLAIRDKWPQINRIDASAYWMRWHIEQFSINIDLRDKFEYRRAYRVMRPCTHAAIDSAKQSKMQSINCGDSSGMELAI